MAIFNTWKQGCPSKKKIDWAQGFETTRFLFNIMSIKFHKKSWAIFNFVILGIYKDF